MEKSRVNIKLGHKDEYRRIDEWPFHISAGGVVYQVEQGKAMVLILHRGPEFNTKLNRESKETWHLPKGTMKYTESLAEGAIREVREEAGVEVEIQAYLGSRIADWIEDGRHYIKDHHYFLMQYLEESEVPMDDEHEAKRWFPIDEAAKRLEWDKEAVATAKIALSKILK